MTVTINQESNSRDKEMENTNEINNNEKPIPSMAAQFDELRPRTYSSPNSKRKVVLLEPCAHSPPPSPHPEEKRAKTDDTETDAQADVLDDNGAESDNITDRGEKITETKDNHANVDHENNKTDKNDKTEENVDEDCVSDEADKSASDADNSESESDEGEPEPNDIKPKCSIDIIITLHTDKNNNNSDDEDCSSELFVPSSSPRLSVHPIRPNVRFPVDLNNNDSGCEAKPKPKKRWTAAFEPEMNGIEEEQDDEMDPALYRRSRSDTVLEMEEVSGLALLIRQDMEKYTKYRCLAQVDKWPSQIMFSKYYRNRPFLLSYTRWLASEGIYTSTSIKTSQGVIRRVSSVPGTITRRHSLLPGGGAGENSNRSSWRRSSLIPDITKFLSGSSAQLGSSKGSSAKISQKSDSNGTLTSSIRDPDASRGTGGINIEDLKFVQEQYKKNNKKDKGFLQMFLCCVSNKSQDIAADDDEANPY